MSIYFRIRRFVTRLWLVLSAIWLALLVLVGSLETMRTDRGVLLIAEPVYWIMIFGPPVLLLVILSLLAWIISGLRDDTDATK